MPLSASERKVEPVRWTGFPAPSLALRVRVSRRKTFQDRGVGERFIELTLS
ncbi:hypothetical protein [Nostoc sp. FACHB-145]|uniref:hypothetical protein n=1 Tax=Nostoc sp. FACHB-145 TaxID=2692836 RepID=UPI0016823ACB|nr:hypothetical protein [Nostoc sp. FACHB-145]MBD2472362.1 hypothetical protein [Nostoc sp. FACHB-145]